MIKKITLNEIDWELLIRKQHASEDLSIFMNKITEPNDHCCPLNEYSVKTKHAIKLYITSAIITSIKIRHNLQRKYAKWPKHDQQ